MKKENRRVFIPEAIGGEKTELIIFIGGAGLNIAEEFKYELLSENNCSHMREAQTLVISDCTHLLKPDSLPYFDYQFCLSWEFARAWNQSLVKRMEIARSELDDFRHNIREGCNSVCVVHAIGGHTGTFAGEAIAQIAFEAGAAVTRVLIMPFKFEGRRRLFADEFLARSLQSSRMDDVVLDNNDVYAEFSHQAKVPDAMSYLNKRAAKAIYTKLGWL